MHKRFRIFALLGVLVLSTILALFPSQNAAAAGTYFLECDTDGDNTFVIFYSANGTNPGDKSGQEVWIANNNGFEPTENTIPGDPAIPGFSATNSCRDDVLIELGSVNVAKSFIDWYRRTPSVYEEGTEDWRIDPSPDGRALLHTFLPPAPNDNLYSVFCQDFLGAGIQVTVYENVATSPESAENWASYGGFDVTPSLYFMGSSSESAITFCGFDSQLIQMLGSDPPEVYGPGGGGGLLWYGITEATLNNLLTTLRNDQFDDLGQMGVIEYSGVLSCHELDTGVVEFNAYNKLRADDIYGSGSVYDYSGGCDSFIATVKGFGAIDADRDPDDSFIHVEFTPTQWNNSILPWLMSLGDVEWSNPGIRIDDPNNPLPDDGENASDGSSDCALGKMGWALCPLLEGIDSMLGGIYGWVEDNFLQIDAAFYDTDSNTYHAWSVFRNIANVVFVILFLIVILSQITSVGINNYGIKKILPELIVAAVLINLSYFIAQILVDLSNIVGSQIKGLLEGIGGMIRSASLAGQEVAGNGGGLVANMTSILVGVGIAAGGVTILAITSGGLGAFFAAALLFLLSALIAIIMIFLLLVARQVGVIIMVVLAPLAFAARILPNTAGLFKTWWKTFTTLLLVYPICGLVIGAGKLAGTIIGGAADDSGKSIFVVVAMIAMIAPYFAVISIIKGSLNGLGKLGGAITGRLNGVKEAGKKNLEKAPGVRNLKTAADRGRNARAETLKAKAEMANQKALAKGNRAIRKMERTKFESTQLKDDAEMARVGQYQGTNRRLQKISARNAARYRVNPDGTPMAGAQRFKAGSHEEYMQMQARTAVLQQETKAAKQIDEVYDNMLSPGDVLDEVYDRGTGALKLSGDDRSDALRMERAISALIKKGDGDSATKLAQAYSNSNLYKAVDASGHINGARALHNQQRIANMLATPEAKKFAPLHAFGWQTGKAAGSGNQQTFSLDDMTAGAIALKRADGSAIVDSTGVPVYTRSMADVLQNKYDAKTITDQDKDSFKYLATSGANFSADQYANALVSGASKDTIDAINTSITAAGLTNDVAGALTAAQMSKLPDSTFLKMAGDELIRAAAANGFTPPSVTDLSSVANLNAYIQGLGASTLNAQAALQGQFRNAYNATQADNRTATNWNADVRNIFGIT